MGVYFLGWVRSGKGVLSAHSVGVGGPLGWVPSAKGVQSAHTKGVRGGGRGVLALWSVTMAQGGGAPLMVIVERANSLKNSSTYRGRAPRGGANVPRGPKGGASSQLAPGWGPLGWVSSKQRVQSAK